MFNMEKFAKISAEVSGKVMRENQDKNEVITRGIISSYEDTDLGEIKGVGEETQRILFENGIYTQENLINYKDLGKLKLPFFSLKAIDKFLATKQK